MHKEAKGKHKKIIDSVEQKAGIKQITNPHKLIVRIIQDNIQAIPPTNTKTTPNIIAPIPHNPNKIPKRPIMNATGGAQIVTQNNKRAPPPPISNIKNPPGIDMHPITTISADTKTPTAEANPIIAEPIHPILKKRLGIQKGIEHKNGIKVIGKSIISIIYLSSLYSYCCSSCFCFSSNSLILIRVLHRGQLAYHLLFPW